LKWLVNAGCPAYKSNGEQVLIVCQFLIFGESTDNDFKIQWLQYSWETSSLDKIEIKQEGGKTNVADDSF
jgi:hypothetical protein